MPALPAIEAVDVSALPPEEQVYAAPHARDGAFFNPWGVGINKGFPDVLRWKMGSRNPFAAAKRKRPELPRASDPLSRWGELPEGARAMWLGHASVLLEIDGVTALIDPLFGRAALAPRQAPAPLLVEQLPRVDVVLLTHGHYDHFDVSSLKALSARFGPELLFAAPLGQGVNLPGGVRQLGLDWWQRFRFNGVEFCFVPAQHWHRRSAFDMNRALWGGWVVRGTRSLYHSGDTGFFGGFKAIGRVFGGVDTAVLPLGAYEPRWFMSQQHMSPEDSVQAFVDLGARNFFAMHWGTFDLTDEPLDHGAFEMLPRVVSERGLPRDAFHVLGHGGSLSFRDQALRSGEAAVPW